MRAGILVAGGTGERFGAATGKQLAAIGGLPVAAHALRALAAAETIDRIVLVCHPDRVEEYRSALVTPDIAGRTTVVAGGSSRRESVAAGLEALDDSITVVVVHDGARPLVETTVIDGAVRALEAEPALDGIVVGHPSYDTIKATDAGGIVVSTPDRSTLWVAQTPQVFRREVLKAAHERAAEEDLDVTDDASIVEHIGGTVRMVEGPRWNLKVTVPSDLEVVEALLALRRKGGTT